MNSEELPLHSKECRLCRPYTQCLCFTREELTRRLGRAVASKDTSESHLEPQTVFQDIDSTLTHVVLRLELAPE